MLLPALLALPTPSCVSRNTDASNVPGKTESFGHIVQHLNVLPLGAFALDPTTNFSEISRNDASSISTGGSNCSKQTGQHGVCAINCSMVSGTGGGGGAAAEPPLPLFPALDAVSSVSKKDCVGMTSIPSNCSGHNLQQPIILPVDEPVPPFPDFPDLEAEDPPFATEANRFLS